MGGVYDSWYPFPFCVIPDGVGERAWAWLTGHLSVKLTTLCPISPSFNLFNHLWHAFFSINRQLIIQVWDQDNRYWVVLKKKMIDTEILLNQENQWELWCLFWSEPFLVKLTSQRHHVVWFHQDINNEWNAGKLNANIPKEGKRSNLLEGGKQIKWQRYKYSDFIKKYFITLNINFTCIVRHEVSYYIKINK